MCLLAVSAVSRCRFLRPLQNIDYFIPGDDPHHRHQSPSPVRDRRQSSSRSRSRQRESGALDSLSASTSIKQPLFAEPIEEEREEKADSALAAADESGEVEEEAGRQGELSHDEALPELGDSEQQSEEQQEAPGTASRSGRRKSTRGVKRESTRAKLRRKTTELVDSATQLITGKRKSRGRSKRAHENEEEEEESEQPVEANGDEEGEEEEEEGASEQPGQDTRQEDEEGQQDDQLEENDQPEGTPAKPRRRSSRLTSQPSRSPLRALTNMLPSSITSRLPSVGEMGERASGDRDDSGSQQRQQQREAETGEGAAEGEAEVRKPAATTSSLFDRRWLLPGLLVALLASIGLMQLFQPHLLPWSSSAASHSLLPLQEADWHRMSHSFLPIKDWHSFKQRWEQWVENDKRRAEDIVGAVKEWVNAKLHKLEQRKGSAEAAADLSELRAEMAKKLSEARVGWLQEVSELVEQRVSSTLGDEAKSRHADVQRMTAELRGEMEQRVADELQRGTDQLLNTVRDELQHRVSKQSDDSEERAVQWQSRLKDEVGAVERRAVDAALAVVDKRFVSSQQLQAVDDDIRKYIHTTLAAQAEQYATADELKQVEDRVMTAVQQMADKQQQQQGGEQRLTADDRRQLIAEVMQAVRDEWAAEKERMKNELRDRLVEETGEEVVKEQSGAIDQLKQQLAELQQRLASSQSKEGQVDSGTRQWVEERVQSALESAHSDESTQQQTALLKKLSVLEAALDELRAATKSATPSSSSSPSSAADIASALEHFAADRTNKVDYALASSGGRIVAHSPTHRAALSSSSVVSPLLALFTSRHLPEVPADALLDADMSVGHCWPMQRQRGSVIIGLRERVRISGMSLQHASVNVLPDGGASMPRLMRLSGVEDEQLDEARRQVLQGDALDEEEQVGSVLGQFEYERDGSQVQQWSIGSKGAGDGGRGYQFVRLDVLSNYGNSNYTCIYRVRVHGEPLKR